MSDDLDGFAQQAQADGGPAAPAADPISDWYSGAGDAAKLSLAVNAGAAIPAERAARIINVAGKTGLPQDLIDRNLDDIEAKARAADFDPVKFRQSSPIVSSWLSEHPNNAAAAREDLSHLGFLERQLGNVRDQFKLGQIQLELARIGEKKLYGQQEQPDVFGAPSLDDRQKHLEGQMAQIPDYGITGFFSGVPGAVANQLPMFGASFMGKVKAAAVGAAAGAGAGLAAGAVDTAALGEAAPIGMAGLAVMGAKSGAPIGWKYGAAVQDARIFGGLAYLDFEKLRDENNRPLDRDALVGASTIVGVVNGALGMIPFEESLKNVPGIRSLGRDGVRELLETPTARAAFLNYARHVGQASALGGGVGFTQAMVQGGAGELAKMAADGSLYHSSPGTILSRIFSDENIAKARSNAVMGVQAAGGTSAALGTTAVYADLQRARTASDNATAIKSAGDTVGNMKLYERLPQATQQLIAKIAQNGAETLHAPVDTFNQYWQSKNVDPRAVYGEITGKPEAYDEALRTGADLPIPTEKYATTIGAVSEHNAFFANELRTDPTAMNGREAADFTKTLEARAAAQGPGEEDQVAGKIGADVKQKLLAAHFSDQAAETQAKLYERFFAVTGKNAGVDPFELYQQYGLNISRELPNVVKEKGVDAMDAMLDRLRAGDIPSEAEASGPDIVQFLREEGGIKGEDEGQDIAALEPDKTRKPFEKNLIRPEGMSADEAARKAAEHGYLGERDIEQLRGAIGDTLAGKPRYSVENTDAGRLADINGLREMDDFLFRNNIDLNQMDNAAVKKLLGEMAGAAPKEPAASEETFFQKAVSAVKQVFGGEAESARQERPAAPEGAGQTRDQAGLPSRLADEVSSYPKSVADNVKNFKALFGEQPLEGTAEILRQELGRAVAGGASHDDAVLERIKQLDQTTGAMLEGKDELAGFPAKAKERLLQSLNREIERRVMLTGEEPAPAVKELHEELRQQLGAKEFNQAAKLPETVKVAGEEKSTRNNLGDKIAQTPGAVKAFYKWFGDSRVVDENGNPRVMYHGTTVDFDEFGDKYGMAGHFGSFDAANTRLTHMAEDSAYDDRGMVYNKPEPDAVYGEDALLQGSAIKPVYLSIENPLRVADVHFDEALTFAEALYNAEVISKKTMEKYSDVSHADNDAAMRELVQMVKDKGYDGLVYENNIEDNQKDSYIPFEASQIKSALGNSGKFSAGSENILEQSARPQAEGPAFKKWFGDSKVVDSRGGPAVFYHVTDADFSKFDRTEDIGFHFGSLDIAHERLRQVHVRDEAGAEAVEGLNIKPVFLKVENPLRMSDHFTWEPDDIKDDLVDKKIITRAQADRVDIVDRERVAKWLEAKGYDGIVYRNLTEGENKGITGKKADSYIVFHPEQIKSAIGNSGEFDSSSKNILEQAAPGDEARGRLRFGNDRQMNIDLLKQADLSTFIHETGHFFMEVLGDLSERKDVSDQVKTDYKTLLDFAGAESRGKLDVEGHEKIARAFESYLMEGKAPSTELRGAFARMRAWLVGVYRQIKALNVELTPDVRNVFDRLLASQDELEAAKREQSVEPLFRDPAAVGMSEKEAAEYRRAIDEAQTASEEQISSRVMGELNREKQAWYKERRAAVRGEIAKEINERPEYVALAALQNGKMPDGSELPEGVTPFKLSKKALVEEYGKDFLKRLPKPYVYSAEGGVNHHQAADVFGYRSGDELVMALANAQNRKQLIEAKTDESMREQYGDMATDGSLAVEAMKAVHTEKRGELLQKELKYLAENKLPIFKSMIRKIARRIAPLEDVRRQAEDAIGDKAPRDIYPSSYQRAETRSHNEAVDAFLRGDVDGAFEAKQRELLNHELFKAASSAREEIDGMVDYASRFDGKELRQKIAKAGGDYLAQIDGLLERFEFKKSTTLKEIRQRETLRAWVDSQQKAGYDLELPENVLNDAYTKSYKEVPLDELRGVVDGVKNIEHLANISNRMLKIREGEQTGALIEEIAASIMAHHEIAKDKPNFAPGMADKLLERGRGVAAMHTRMEFLFEHLDGMKQNGPAWSLLFKPFADADDAESNMMARSSGELERIFGAYDKSERAMWFLKKTYVPEVDGNFTKANMIALALNMGNAYNKDGVMRGYGWNESQVQAILKHLGAKDWRTVQAVWDHLESYWPAIEAQERKLTGTAPQKVEATPFTVMTPEGPVDLKGGYYPIVFDRSLSWRQAALSEKENVKEMFGGSWARAQTKQGHVIERQNTGGKPILLQLTGLSNHLSAITHDLAFRESVIDAHKIINDPGMRDTIGAAVGKEMYKQLNPWLAAIASDRRGEPANAIEGLLSGARSGATIVNLGLKVTTGLVHALGYNLAVKELGPEYAGKGLWDAWKQPYKLKETWDFISSRSDMMKFYPDNMDRDVRDALRELNVGDVGSGPMGAVDVYTNNVRHSYLSYITYMNLASAIPAWMGGYRKAMDGAVDGIDGGDEKSAVDYADKVVRQTKGASSAKDLAAVQRGSQSFRLFTMFYSQQTLNFNQFQKTWNQFRLDRNVPQMLGSTAMAWFVPAVLDQVIRGHGPKDNAEDESKLSWWGRKIALYPFESVILLRDIARAADKYLETGEPDFQASPVFDAFNTAAKGLAVPFKALGDKPLKRSDVRDAVNTAGYAFHLPTRQAWASGEYLYDWMTGQQSPSNPAEAVWRTAVGEQKKK